ncbi:hypothetical protein ACFLUO_09470 [Chloroflexota bacterium]
MNEVEDIAPGIQSVVLDTNELYPNCEERYRFEIRLREFLKVGISSEIMNYNDGILSYLTETVIPTNQNSRPPVLLLFGNPAPSSVLNKCFFARKEGKHDLPFWPTLAKADIVSINTASEEINTARTKAIFDLDYESPFRLGLTVFHSIPSPASGYPWSGVDGLRKLFGRKALRKIAEAETKRVKSHIRGLIGNDPRGAVIVFQKDAYLGINDKEYPAEVITKVGKQCVVKTRCSDSNVKLFRMPPTRYIRAHWYVKFLRLVAERIMKES